MDSQDLNSRLRILKAKENELWELIFALLDPVERGRLLFEVMVLSVFLWVS